MSFRHLLPVFAIIAALLPWAARAQAPHPVKVLIVSMFGAEAKPWLEALKFTEALPVPGLSPDYPELRCTAEEVCLMTTGMGEANAAASLTALIFSGRVDLSRAYVLVAGI